AGGQEGKTRFFYRWEGKNLTDTNWKPMGIAMEGDPSLGETPGGLQAPHAIKLGKTYHMFYGDWVNICHAISKDGKKFRRQICDNGKTGMFNEGDGEHARDPMLLLLGDKYHCYYTAHSMRSPSSNHRGVNYCRISTRPAKLGSVKGHSRRKRLCQGAVLCRVSPRRLSPRIEALLPVQYAEVRASPAYDRFSLCRPAPFRHQRQ
ncbi:unnamed protein product, partial [marine sediment metagenome]